MIVDIKLTRRRTMWKAPLQRIGYVAALSCLIASCLTTVDEPEVGGNEAVTCALVLCAVPSSCEASFLLGAHAGATGGDRGDAALACGSEGGKSVEHVGVLRVEVRAAPRSAAQCSASLIIPGTMTVL